MNKENKNRKVFILIVISVSMLWGIALASGPITNPPMGSVTINDIPAGNISWTGNASGNFAIPKTYTQLLALAASNGLKVGQQYVMTDYQTRHVIAGANAAAANAFNQGPVEPLIITAVTTGVFSPQAHSTTYPNDVIFYELVLSHTYYQWDTSAAANYGWIYYRKDTNRNVETNYDFRSIVWRRWVDPLSNYSYPDPKAYSALTEALSDGSGEYLDFYTFDPTYYASGEVSDVHLADTTANSTTESCNNVFFGTAQSLRQHGAMAGNTHLGYVFDADFGVNFKNNVIDDGSSHNRWDWAFRGFYIGQNLTGNRFAGDISATPGYSTIGDSFKKNRVWINQVNFAAGNNCQDNDIILTGGSVPNITLADNAKNAVLNVPLDVTNTPTLTLTSSRIELGLSNAETSIDITGAANLSLAGVWQWAGVINLTTTNASETITTIESTTDNRFPRRYVVPAGKTVEFTNGAMMLSGAAANLVIGGTNGGWVDTDYGGSNVRYLKHVNY